jgi:ACS family glucarate transporter-like MFS transporter
MPKRHWLIFGTFLLTMLLYVDRVCVSSAKEAITRDLGLSDTQFGWVLSAFALGYALFQTPSGVLADRFGPRIVLTSVMSFWSLFTGMTAFARGLVSLVVYRFLFGAGEAGAFPSMTRAYYSWLPTSERGLAQGINFSGSRIGAALALPLVAVMVSTFGWRNSLIILALVGFARAAIWWYWFRDDPADHPSISEEELQLILGARQADTTSQQRATRISVHDLFGSRNMRLAMFQYFSSNFTFFFTLTWMFPHLQSTFGLDAFETGLYASAPLVAGAAGNWVSGALVDSMYKRGNLRASRQWPAIMGFTLAAGGLLGSIFMTTPLGAVLWLSIAIFGADMTLPPSWSFCIDIGRNNAGAVSGTMNMTGNLGSFVTGLAFPYLYAWTSSTTPFFVVGSILNLVAIGAWVMTRPDRPVGHQATELSDTSPPSRPDR